MHLNLNIQFKPFSWALFDTQLLLYWVQHFYVHVHVKYKIVISSINILYVGGFKPLGYHSFLFAVLHLIIKDLLLHCFTLTSSTSTESQSAAWSTCWVDEPLPCLITVCTHTASCGLLSFFNL